jgi:hypothetical protein
MTTKVIFRMFKNPYDKNDDVIALFPELPGDTNPYVTCLSYQHIGQHGAACVNLTGRYTKPAREDQYKDLLAELVSIGYNDLKIVKRRTLTDLVKRIDACKA